MAVKGRTSRVSSGNSKKIRAARVAKMAEKVAARKENGKAYEYKPNPYEKDSKEWRRERKRRAEKQNVSKKSPYAKLTSIFAKLDNELAKQAMNKKKSLPKKEIE